MPEDEGFAPLGFTHPALTDPAASTARKWIQWRLRVAHTPPRTPRHRSQNGTKMDCIALARCAHTPPHTPTPQPRRHENGLHCACALRTPTPPTPPHRSQDGTTIERPHPAPSAPP